MLDSKGVARALQNLTKKWQPVGCRLYIIGESKLDLFQLSLSAFSSFVFLMLKSLVFLILKFNETSMKNGQKINPKSIKNGPKIDQKSSKIEVWRDPGQVWRPLGPSWAIQSVFGSILDCLGSVLEASWRGLGGLLGGLWLRKVANLAPT